MKIMKIINFKNKKMKLLTKELQESYKNAKKKIIFVSKKLKIDIWKINNVVKLEIIAIIQGNKEVQHISYVIQNVLYLKKFL